MKIKVLRSFIFNGDPVSVGQELDVSDAFAAEIVGLNKAEKVDKTAKAGPMSTKTAGAIVEGGEAAEAEPAHEKTLHKPAHHGKK